MKKKKNRIHEIFISNMPENVVQFFLQSITFRIASVKAGDAGAFASLALHQYADK